MSRIKCFLLEDTGEKVTRETKYGFSTDRIYKRCDTGETGTLDTFPPGAMWDADWYHGISWLCGPDGHSYMVRTPGGDWCIDSVASNCGLPNDKIHKCWVRHGEAPDFTVDKNGNTCSAGGGSIAIGSYHGFLRNGYLED